MKSRKSLAAPLALAAGAFTLSIGSATAEPALAPGTYQLDPAHSKVGFEVPHLVVSSVEGRFNDYQGEIVVGKKLQDSKVDVTIDSSSIDTGNKKRDDHLRSPDFFDAEKHPKITFKSKRVSGSPESLRIVGDLTLHGVTREVALDGKYLGTAKDAWGNQKAAFEARGRINRRDFGLTWSNVVEAGPVVGDQVTLAFKIQGGRPAQKQ